MSLCIRCGKPRIAVTTYEEQVEKSVVTYTVTECSDPECQKLVETTLSSEKSKRKAVADEKVKREMQRIALNKMRKIANT